MDAEASLHRCIYGDISSYKFSYEKQAHLVFAPCKIKILPTHGHKKTAAVHTAAVFYCLAFN